MYRCDSDLVQACLNGDQCAWDLLVDRYARLVHSIPRRYGMDDADSDDVAQFTFIQLFRNLERLRDQARLSSWLITTAHRESWRVGKRTDKYAGLDDRIHNVAAPEEDELIAWERQQIVREGLDQLSEPCAGLLRALFLEGADPSYDRIAERFDMPRGSIGPTRARCLKKLEAILAELGLAADGS